MICGLKLKKKIVFIKLSILLRGELLSTHKILMLLGVL